MPRTKEATLKEKMERKFYAKLSSNKNQDILTQIYQLKILICNIYPPIWRRILILNRSTLRDLHKSIQKWFNWSDYHLYEFYFYLGKDFYSRTSIRGSGGLLGPKIPDPKLNEEEIRLCDVFTEYTKKIWYLYDFGDNWEHEITLERIFPYREGFKESICVGGDRAAPPEDCGGVWGYQDILKALNNPTNPEYSQLLEWVGEDFDPEDMGISIEQMTQKEIEQKMGKKES